MKSKKTLLTLILLFIACTYTQTGCQKDPKKNNNQQQQAQVKFVISDSIIKPYQIIQIHVDGILTQDTYTGKLGTTDVTFKKISANELVLLTPDINPGSYLLTSELIEKPINVTISQSTAVTDPDGFIMKFVSEANNAFDSIQQQDSSLQLSPELSNSKNEINQAYSDYKKLSSVQKIQVVTFLQNNQKLIDDLKTSVNNYYKAQKKGKNKGAAENFVILSGTVGALIATAAGASGGAVIVTAAIAMEIGYHFFWGHASPVLNTALKALNEGFHITYWGTNYLADVTYDKASNIVQTKENKKKGVIEINNNQKINCLIKPTFRSIQASDEFSSSTAVSGFIKIYNKLRSIWTDYLAGKFGSLPTYSNVTEQKFADDISKFNVQVTTNGTNVKVSNITGSASSFFISFSTTQTTDQNFSFSITFTDGTVKASKDISCILKSVSPYVGTWVMYSGASSRTDQKLLSSDTLSWDAQNETFGFREITGHYIPSPYYKSVYPNCKSLPIWNISGYKNYIFTINDDNTFSIDCSQYGWGIALSSLNNSLPTCTYPPRNLSVDVEKGLNHLTGSGTWSISDNIISFQYSIRNGSASTTLENYKINSITSSEMDLYMQMPHVGEWRTFKYKKQ